MVDVKQRHDICETRITELSRDMDDGYREIKTFKEAFYAEIDRVQAEIQKIDVITRVLGDEAEKVVDSEEKYGEVINEMARLTEQKKIHETKISYLQKELDSRLNICFNRVEQKQIEINALINEQKSLKELETNLSNQPKVLDKE